MLRAMVTGGAGFVGSHLCEQLLLMGCEVYCLDNLQTGSYNNVLPLVASKRFHFLQHDVIEPLFVDVDQIYHLACPASPAQYQSDPIHTLKTCVLGTLNALGLAKRLGARLLLSSTSEVYGDPTEHPQPESYWGNVNSFGPRACYDEGKRCAETIAYEYHAQHGVAIKVARIFNTYGPRMDPEDGRVVSNFIVQALSGNPLTIHGDGSQTRSFCYVDDTVDALIRFMGTESHCTGPINIGNPNEMTVGELASTVLRLTDSTAPINHLPLPQDDPRQRKPDITAARTTLDWEPNTDLSTGLKQTIKYFRDRCPSNADVQQPISAVGA